MVKTAKRKRYTCATLKHKYKWQWHFGLRRQIFVFKRFPMHFKGLLWGLSRTRNNFLQECGLIIVRLSSIITVSLWLHFRKWSYRTQSMSIQGGTKPTGKWLISIRWGLKGRSFKTTILWLWRRCAIWPRFPWRARTTTCPVPIVKGKSSNKKTAHVLPRSAEGPTPPPSTDTCLMSPYPTR